MTHYTFSHKQFSFINDETAHFTFTGNDDEFQTYLDMTLEIWFDVAAPKHIDSTVEDRMKLTDAWLVFDDLKVPADSYLKELKSHDGFLESLYEAYAEYEQHVCSDAA